MEDQRGEELGSYLRNEQGATSSARLLLWLMVGFTLACIILDSTGLWDVTGEVWGLLGGMVLAFTGWAAGPRIAQYLLPQVGAMVAGVTAGKRREPDRPDPDGETMRRR